MTNLLAKGADPKDDYHGTTPLYIVAEAGHWRLLAPLVRAGATLDDDDSIASPLAIAAFLSNLECVKELLRLGADVNYRFGQGETALLWAADAPRGPRGSIHSPLKLTKPTKPDPRLVQRNLEIVRLLIRHGADVNVVSDDGDTALGYARCYNKVKIAQLLVRAGATNASLSWLRGSQQKNAGPPRDASK
jgi:ankyrin repeat protein